MFWWKIPTVSHHFDMFDIFGGHWSCHWSNASGDIKYLVRHMTSQNYVIEG